MTDAVSSVLGTEICLASEADARALKLFTEICLASEADAKALKLFFETLNSANVSATARDLTVETLSLSEEISAEGLTLSAEVMFASSEALGKTLTIETLSNFAPQILAQTLQLELLISTDKYYPVFAYPVKFHKNNSLLWGTEQTNPETFPALQATDAIAALNLSFEDSISSSIIPYGETASGRSAAVSIENIIRTVKFETLFPIIDVTQEVTLSSLFLGNWLEACGATASIVGGKLQFSNETISDKRLGIQVSKTSDENTEKENIYRVENAIGQVGLVLTAKKLGKLNFIFSGSPSLPEFITRTNVDFGGQKLKILGPLNRNNIVSATLKDLETSVEKEFCFYRLKTADLFGFDLENLQLSSEEVVSRATSNPALALTVLLDPRNGIDNFIPEYCVGRNYSMKLVLLSEETPITLEFSELYLTEYQSNDVGEYSGLTIGFRNTGFTTLTFTGLLGDA